MSRPSHAIPRETRRILGDLTIALNISDHDPDRAYRSLNSSLLRQIEVIRHNYTPAQNRQYIDILKHRKNKFGFQF